MLLDVTTVVVLIEKIMGKKSELSADGVMEMVYELVKGGESRICGLTGRQVEELRILL